MISASVAVLWLTAAASQAAPTPAPLQRSLGEVTAVDAAGRRLALKTDTGEAVSVTTDEKTSLLRAQPGARDLAGAAAVTLAEIAVGDRVLARGTPGSDKVLAARQVVLMARADIAQKNEQEAAEWRRRGVSGLVTAIDPATQAITVEVRSLAGAQSVVVGTTAGKTSFKRYAPESVRFSDARPSAFADVRVGDQVRVLGDRAPEGARLAAEQVVSGSFQIVSGAVKSVAGQTVTLTSNENGRTLTVTVGPDALVRRLPPEMAAGLATRSRGGAAGPGAPRGPGRPGADGARGGAPNLHDMLERLPALPVSQLKPGDQVAVSSTTGADPSRLTAVVLLAGIEPLLESRPRGAAGGGETLGLAAGALDMGLGIP